MKTHTLQISFLTAALVMGATNAQASHYENDNALIRARVISSTPIYQSINEPHRECWNETRDYETRSYRNNNTQGSIIGALAGGLLGSVVGKGNGRVAAAAVGAATGAVVGGNWNNGDRYNSYPQQAERCRTINHTRQVMNGYDVRYRVQGREFNTHLPYDPGKWVNLDANFTVADDQRDQRDDRFYNSSYQNDRNQSYQNDRNQWNDRNPWNDD